MLTFIVIHNTYQGWYILETEKRDKTLNILGFKNRKCMIFFIPIDVIHCLKTLTIDQLTWSSLGLSRLTFVTRNPKHVTLFERYRIT